MANTIILPPISVPKIRTTTMIVNTNQKIHSSSLYIVHNSTSNLPDIVNDCYHQQDDLVNIHHQETQILCKQIAHSLRLVADQVDKKYCQNDDFTRDLYFLSIRLILNSTHIRTILYTIWARAFLPFFLLICKTKTFFF